MRVNITLSGLNNSLLRRLCRGGAPGPRLVGEPALALGGREVDVQVGPAVVGGGHLAVGHAHAL